MGLIEILTYQVGPVGMLLVVYVLLFLAIYFQVRVYRQLRRELEALKGQKGIKS